MELPAVLALVATIFKLPSLNATVVVSVNKGFIVAKLLVGVSVVTSVAARLTGAK